MEKLKNYNRSNAMSKKIPPIVSIKNLAFEYSKGYPVLKNIHFDILEGDFIGLVGPNGGGKSTLLRLMVGILPLQKGSVELFGEKLQHFKHWDWIGYISQKATHFDKRFPATVTEVVRMGLTASKSKDEKVIERALKDVQMWEYRDTPLFELSGGQQQRVFIARALASNPRLLVLDEPTTGVDVPTQEQFYNLLQKLRQEKNLTIILVSHDIDVVATQSNTFACINQTLVYHGEPKEFVKGDYLEKLYGKNLRMVLHGH